MLLGFVIFLAFNAYDRSSAGAEAEATVVAQQVETAQFFDSTTRDQLTALLVCYGRSVVGSEWEQQEAGELDDRINPWATSMFEVIRAFEPSSGAEQTAYDRWMDQTSAREQARNDRVHTVDGVVPTPLWVVLLVIAGVIFVYMLFFADSAEGAGTQAVLMGSVSVVITTLILLLVFLNRPYGDGVGALRPAAMERTLRIIDQELAVAGFDLELGCDPDGNAN